MKFVFIAKHRSIWPVAWMCDALGVTRLGHPRARRYRLNHSTGFLRSNCQGGLSRLQFDLHIGVLAEAQ